jgi:hypothetical protein
MSSKEFLFTLAAGLGIGFIGLGYQKNIMMQMLLTQKNAINDIKMKIKEFKH